MAKQRLGYIGVGLMGHGAAKNMLQNGYPLTIMGHRNRAPVDDLVALGAREVKTAADVARASDVLFLCLPSTVEVEHTIYGAGGVLEGAARGLIVVDSTTADPRSTQRIGADLAKQGIRMADAPLGRTPKESEAGKLSTFIGGDPETVRELKPIIECYADTIIEAGVLGAGHTLKLINNFIAIGTSGVIAEALATATKLGVDLSKLYEVVSAGGGNGQMYQMLMPGVLVADDGHLRG